jgi:hypothetical protein
MFSHNSHYRKIFIIIFFFCLVYLSARSVRFPEIAGPMDRYGLSAEKLIPSKTRAVDSLNCELVGGWFRGPSYAVSIVDTIAYLGGALYMKILNVKDSTDPILLGEIRFPSGFIWDIFVKDTFTYVADYEEGLRVINVSDPSSPAEIGFCETPGHAQALWVQDTFAYIADNDYNPSDNRGLRIIDISDPSSPTIVGSYNEPWAYYCNDVWVQDTIAYVAGTGLRIINVSNPSSPYNISVFNDMLNFSRLYVRDTLAYTASFGFDTLFISIVNVADPSSPVEVGSYSLNIDFPYNVGEIGDIFVQDSLAYIAVFSLVIDPDSCGLYIVNVSDPASMSEVGNYLTDGGRAQDVWVKDNLAYVSCCVGYYKDDPEGLIIIDVSEPSSPAGVGE